MNNLVLGQFELFRAAVLASESGAYSSTVPFLEKNVSADDCCDDDSAAACDYWRRKLRTLRDLGPPSSWLRSVAVPSVGHFQWLCKCLLHTLEQGLHENQTAIVSSSTPTTKKSRYRRSALELCVLVSCVLLECGDEFGQSVFSQKFRPGSSLLVSLRNNLLQFLSVPERVMIFFLTKPLVSLWLVECLVTMFGEKREVQDIIVRLSQECVHMGNRECAFRVVSRYLLLLKTQESIGSGSISISFPSCLTSSWKPEEKKHKIYEIFLADWCDRPDVLKQFCVADVNIRRNRLRHQLEDTVEGIVKLLQEKKIKAASSKLKYWNYSNSCTPTQIEVELPLRALVVILALDKMLPHSQSVNQLDNLLNTFWGEAYRGVEDFGVRDSEIMKYFIDDGCVEQTVGTVLMCQCHKDRYLFRLASWIGERNDIAVDIWRQLREDSTSILELIVKYETVNRVLCIESISQLKSYMPDESDKSHLSSAISKLREAVRQSKIVLRIIPTELQVHLLDKVYKVFEYISLNNQLVGNGAEFRSFVTEFLNFLGESIPTKPLESFSEEMKEMLEKQWANIRDSFARLKAVISFSILCKDETDLVLSFTFFNQPPLKFLLYSLQKNLFAVSYWLIVAFDLEASYIVQAATANITHAVMDNDVICEKEEACEDSLSREEGTSERCVAVYGEIFGRTKSILQDDQNAFILPSCAISTHRSLLAIYHHIDFAICSASLELSKHLMLKAQEMFNSVTPSLGFESHLLYPAIETIIGISEGKGGDSKLSLKDKLLLRGTDMDYGETVSPDWNTLSMNELSEGLDFKDESRKTLFLHLESLSGGKFKYLRNFVKYARETEEILRKRKFGDSNLIITRNKVSAGLMEIIDCMVEDPVGIRKQVQNWGLNDRKVAIQVLRSRLFKNTGITTTKEETTKLIDMVVAVSEDREDISKGKKKSLLPAAASLDLALQKEGNSGVGLGYRNEFHDVEINQLLSGAADPIGSNSDWGSWIVENDKNIPKVLFSSVMRRQWYLLSRPTDGFSLDANTQGEGEKIRCRTHEQMKAKLGYDVEIEENLPIDTCKSFVERLKRKVIAEKERPRYIKRKTEQSSKTSTSFISQLLLVGNNKKSKSMKNHFVEAINTEWPELASILENFDELDLPTKYQGNTSRRLKIRAISHYLKDKIRTTPKEDAPNNLGSIPAEVIKLIPVWLRLME